MRVRDAVFQTYEELDQFLGQRDEAKVCCQTWVFRSCAPHPSSGELIPCISVKHHYTIIVRHWPKQEGLYACLFSTGGWNTVTTKVRLNNFLPVQVWSYKKQWYYGAEWNTVTTFEQVNVVYY